MIWGL